jgi:hypothetical protein
MAYRRSPHKPANRLRLSQVLPPVQPQLSNQLAFALLERFGITDLSSYLSVWRIPIVLCVILGACIGAFQAGLTGFALGGLLGALAPAGLVWLGVVLLHAAIVLAIYFACWAVILAVGWWMLHL